MIKDDIPQLIDVKGKPFMDPNRTKRHPFFASKNTVSLFFNADTSSCKEEKN